MTPLEKFMQSRKFIMRNQCFFATLLHNLTVVEQDDGTMATDGNKLMWSPSWVDGISVFNTTFVIIHEVLHVVFKHHLRRKNRDPEVWNIACDYVINAYIVYMGLRKRGGQPPMSPDTFKVYGDNIIREPSAWLSDKAYHMPKDGLFDAKFYGMSAEQVYDILMQENKSDDQQDQSDTGQSDGDGQPSTEDNIKANHPLPDWGNVDDTVNDEGDAPSADEIREIERKLDQQISTAAEVAKGRGQMGVGMSQAIDANNTPSQDWRDVLSDLLQDQIPTDLTFDKPNRYYSTDEFILPSVAKEGIGNLAIFADASGSVSQPEFSQFMSDIQDITDELLPESVTLVQFDHDCSDPEIIERGDEPELVRRRSGGTCFKAPFEFCQDKGLMDDFDTIIVFTDGGADDYVDEPDVPVIWATTGTFWGGPPPWGEVVGVNFEGDRRR